MGLITSCLLMGEVSQATGERPIRAGRLGPDQNCETAQEQKFSDRLSSPITLATMRFWEPVAEVRRQQEGLAKIERPEALHADYSG